MSQLQRFVWQRLGSLATALLIVPGVAWMSIAAQAAPPSQKQTACRGAEVLQPNDPDVQALRSLLQRYRISVDGIGEQTTTRYEFAYKISSALAQLKQKLTEHKAEYRELFRLSAQDLVLITTWQKNLAAELKLVQGEDNSTAIYFQALHRLLYQNVSTADIQAFENLGQRYGLRLLEKGIDKRYNFPSLLNVALKKLSQKIADSRADISEPDLMTIMRLQGAYLSDLEIVNDTIDQSGYNSLISYVQTHQDGSWNRINVNKTNAQVTDILALRYLIQKYTVGTLPLIDRDLALTRHEFAAGLNAVLDRINELIAAGNASLVAKADLATLQRLQEAYAPELATLRGRVDALEARAATLSAEPFSTTTKLSGEVIVNGTPSMSAPAAAPLAPPLVRAMPPIGDISGAIAPTKPSLARPSSPVPVFTDQSRFNQPGTGNTENYNPITENAFLRPSTSPLSTFSIDVDTASYSNVRRFINEGQLPPKDAVRLEELINYFPYDYPQPEGDKPFSVTTDVAAAPWNPKHKLVQIGLKGKQLQTVQPSNLVFLVDVSGSMDEPNKLPLVKQSLCLLVNELTAQDRVTLVVYAGNAGLVLPPTPGNQKQKILDAIDHLEAGGSTAGGAGIELAYKLAQQSFLKNGNNRVILATDGDFNVGVSSDAELVRLIEQKRDRGIFLTVLGFGTGNTKDSKMEQLADKGNGNYAYIDTLLEARKVLVNDLRSTLFTIAKDVKIQVEFNPANVQAYRLIGYENRLLQDQDFNDDKKDAGEIGAGRTVTALYEIIPTGIESDVKLSSIDPLKYQHPTAIASAPNRELMQVKLRYKNPNDATSQLITHPILNQNTPLDATSNNLKFSAAVAMFGMVLRESEFKGQANFDTVLRLAKQAKGNDPNGYRAEFIRLVDRCKVLLAQTQKPDRRASNDVEPQRDRLLHPNR